MHGICIPKKSAFHSYITARKYDSITGLQPVMATQRVRRVLKLQRTGNIKDLKIETETLGELAPDDIRILVHAVGLNFADVFTCLGLYNAAPPTNVIPGLEFAGEVTATGERVQHVRAGDRVMGVRRFGSFATSLDAPAMQVRMLPDGWDYQTGASFLVQSLTVYYGLRSLGNIQAGHTVLIHSAAGGCGQAALKICAAVGATAVATVGSQSKAAYLIQQYPHILSVETVIVRDSSRFAQQLGTALSSVQVSGFDIVLDAVSGEYFQPGYDALRNGGRYVIYGVGSWTPTGDKPGWLKLAWQYIRRPRLDPITMIGENRSVMGFNLIHMFERADLLGQLVDDLQALNLPPPKVGECFAFDDAKAALKKLQSGTTMGKLVLTVENHTGAGLS